MLVFYLFLLVPTTPLNVHRQLFHRAKVMFFVRIQRFSSRYLEIIFQMSHHKEEGPVSGGKAKGEAIGQQHSLLAGK